MSGLYTRLTAGLLFPLHERLKRHSTVAVRRQLEQSQWWPAEQLRELQVQRLRALLVEVGSQVPFYRDLFREQGFDASSVTSLADLQRLPFLTKPVIRAHTDAMKHRQAEGLARFNTGGSSGEPLIFFIGNERVSHDVAAKWRATRWWGVDIGDPEIVVWGSPIELGAQDRVRALRDKLLRTELIPAFEMNDASLDGFVAAIRRRRPRMLFGYPSALSHIARHAEKRGQRMDDLDIAVAFVTSERLYDDQRQTISRVFGCAVANGYGGRDAGFIAHECPHGGMHLTAEDVIVEIVDAEGRVLPPGQAGEIVVTHLATKDFPFIRYRTGDVAVLDDRTCGCGRGLPLLKEIQGRTTDFVVAADGTVMHGLALVYIVRDLPGVRSFKIVQHSLERTVVQLVVDGQCDRSIEPRIVQGFKRRLGATVNVDVEYLAEIAPERSGKYRYVVSQVASLPTPIPAEPCCALAGDGHA
ncbi:MAG: phenylacetate--CoA ligase family protein [Burkholderiaceae bacterium]|nr:phenylacetate--CoA ligase family protein [Burkholderiaceae bacterium]